MNKVFITGKAAIVGGLTNLDALWENAQQNCRLPAKVPDASSLFALAKCPASDWQILANHQRLAFAAIELALLQSNIKIPRQKIRGQEPTVRLPRFGCVSGSSLGGLCAFDEELPIPLPSQGSPYSLSRWRGNAIGGATTVRYGLGGGDYSLNCASATGGQVLYLAGSLIASGALDAVIAVAADSAPSMNLSAALWRTGAVSKELRGGPLQVSRSGMVPSPGAAVMILESEKHLKERQGHALVQWLGGTCTSEAYHLLAPEPGAIALKEAIKNTPYYQQASWLSLHATGTPKYDAIEMAAIHEIYGDKEMFLSAFKGSCGHALSACGLIEAALMSHGLEQGLRPAFPQNTDPALKVGRFEPQMMSPLPHTGLVISEGMGGNVVVNALGHIKG